MEGVCTTCKYWDKISKVKGCTNITIMGLETLRDRCYSVSEKINRYYYDWEEED